jgi:single-strand DNA-binding protein
MASGLNKISVIGNLGKDPEVRYTQSGTPVCSFRIGVTEKRKEGEEWKDHTEWFTIICFGKTAENAGKYLKKGRQIYAEGRLQTRSYQDKDNKDRVAIEIVANQIVFLGGNKEGSAEGEFFGTSSLSNPSSSSSSSYSSKADNDFINDDDIPF